MGITEVGWWGLPILSLGSGGFFITWAPKQVIAKGVGVQKEKRLARRGRILIADDEETFLQSTADLLRGEGYECTCASDAKTTVEKLRKKKYDLLIADIKMQGNSDLQLIKNLPEIVGRMPVILVTGYPSLSSAVQSITLPVVGYLIKPFEFTELLSVAQSAIAGKGIHLRAKHLFRVINAIRNDLEDVGEVHSQTELLEHFGSITMKR